MLTHKQTWMNVWLVLNLSNFIIFFFGLPNSLSHFNAILGRKVRKLLESYDIFQVYSLNRLNALMSMTIWDMFSNTHTRMWHISWCFDHQGHTRMREREREITLGMVACWYVNPRHGSRSMWMEFFSLWNNKVNGPDLLARLKWTHVYWVVCGEVWI